MFDLKSKPLLFASHNEKKIEELRSFFSSLGISIISAKDENLDEVEETGSTFEENAYLKASCLSKKTGLITLGDDSGLCVKSLNNNPGVNTKRYAENHGGFPAVFDYLENKLKNKSKEAEFICVLAFVSPNLEKEFFIGKTKGVLVFPEKGDRKFAFDPIFQPIGYDKTFAQMSLEEKSKHSHRGKALKKLKEAYF